MKYYILIIAVFLSIANANAEKKEKTKADYQQRNQEKNRIKKIQKEIEIIEEKISKLEQYRKEFEIRLSDSNFYSNPNHTIELQNYEKSKKHLI